MQHLFDVLPKAGNPVGRIRRKLDIGEDMRGLAEHEDASAQFDSLLELMSDDHRRVAFCAGQLDKALRSAADVTSSRWPNASSAKRSAGSMANARANATRWRMPPDSSWG